MPQDQSKPAAPYLPWKTFLNSFDVFSQGIPRRIHRTVWKQAGLIQGLLMGAYRFFGLIDDEDKPTSLLANVSKLAPENRPPMVREMLKAAYPAIMSHDLGTMTIPILNELIERYNVSGATKKKAITFFLQAAKYANLPLSSFIKVRNSGPRRRRARNGDELGNVTPISQQPTGSEKVVQLNSGGTLTLRVSVDFLSLNEGDRKFVFELVDRLNGYSPTRTAHRTGLSEAHQ